MLVPEGEARHALYFRPLHVVLRRPGFEPIYRGADHALELVGRDGAVLESHPVYVSIGHDDPGGPFEDWTAVFEDPPDYAAYRFVYGSRVVYEKRRSPNAPEVSILGLEPGQLFAGDAEFGFQLLVDDEDGDELDTKILVSVDGGSFEHTRAFQGSELRDLAIEDYGSPFTVTSGVHVPGVPRIVATGSQSVRLLAVVSDGSRVAAAQSPEFALEPMVAAPPRLQIQHMRSGETIGALGPFEISAWVQEPRLHDGELVYEDTYHPRPGSEQAVRWTSDIDGDVTEHITSVAGRNRINAAALTPGTHELTATFTADSGLQASDSATVTILGPDDPVAAIDDRLGVAVGETLEHPVTANDVETSRLIDIDTLEIVTPPKLGTASVLDMPSDRTGPGRVIQYTPDYLNIDLEDTREDTLTYQICDKGPDPQCATAQVRITIYNSGNPYWFL